MALSDKASIEFEAGQTLKNFEILADSGDHLKHTASAKPWSNKSGFSPTVLPNGLATGGAVVPAVSGTNDLVDVAALTCYLAGVLTSVGADTDVAITRGLTTDTHNITSITVNSGGTISAVSGTDNTAFSEVRGDPGGPPFIPVGSIEIAQVRTTSVTAAPITADEIFAVVGQHLEKYDFPTWNVDHIRGEINFLSALPLIHTGSVAKRIYMKFYTPIFQEAPRAVDFAPIETSHSTGSVQVYNETIGSVSSSLGQGSFQVRMNNGHTDSLLSQKDEIIMVRFKQDRNLAPYSLTQGKLGVSRTYPASDHVTAACTLSGERATVDFAS